jgi:uncharacterized protein YjbI with pentapeptide repeats
MADKTKARTKSGRGQMPPAPVAQTPPPSTEPAFAAEARDLKALRDAVVDAASVGAGLWFSYLFVLLYLVVAVGSVTHRDLLFENPIKLPFLSVELPLTGFFVLGPGLFLIVHVYVLLHFVLLAGKVGVFHDELLKQIADEGTRARLRGQLPSNIFVQFLAGPREVRTGVMGAMLRLIAQISLVAGPLALLVFFQLQFLPYHHEPIAWWQRLVVVADLALLWTLWPSVARGETMSIGWRDFRHWRAAAAAVASLMPVFLVFTIATFPGEWLHENLPSARFIPSKESKFGFRLWISPHEVLFAGDIDLVTRRPTSLWSNRLVLPGIDVIDHGKFDSDAKIAAAPETFSLRDRRLEGAVLLGARMRKVDFTAARLQGAALDDADLREARFECAESSIKVGVGAEFQRQFENSEIRCAQLQRASLDGAQLQGAKLNKANLQGASLGEAQLQGASLDGTLLQGASLVGAQLQGASLGGTQLNGVRLDRAQLQGASLDHFYNISGDATYGIRPSRGAKVDGVYPLQFGVFAAQLQGAKLDGAELGRASLDGSLIWRADVRRARSKKDAYVVAPEGGPKYRGLGCNQEDPCDWSVESFAVLKRLIEEGVPKGDRRDQALKRIETLNPAMQLDGQADMAKAWAEFAQSSPPLAVYKQRLAEEFEAMGCNPDATLYTIRRLIFYITARLGETPHAAAALADAFLDETNCQGARSWPKAEKIELRRIRERINVPRADPAPTTPKQ